LLWRGLVVSKLLWGWEVWSQQRETIHAWWSILEKHFVWTWSWQFASFAKPPWLISFMQRALCVYFCSSSKSKRPLERPWMVECAKQRNHTLLCNLILNPLRLQRKNLGTMDGEECWKHFTLIP
jgi:hypothetical protein